MKKWHVHSGIGRARPVLYKPRRTTLSSRHYIHTTALRRQEGSQPKTAEETSKPSLNSTKRVEEATSSIGSAWRAHAPKNSQHLDGIPLSKDVIDSTRSPGSSARMRLPKRRGANPPAEEQISGARPNEAERFNFKRVGGRTADGVHAGAIDARSLGESKRVFPNRNNEARTPSAVNQPVIDARSLNARIKRPQRPSSISSVGTGTDRQPAIDARSLGAGINEAQRHFIRKVEARKSDEAHPPAIDARSLGAGTNEAQRPLIRRHGASSSAIDARSLGAGTNEAQRPLIRKFESRKSDGANPPAIDARSLGAGTNEAQRPLTRKFGLESSLPDRHDSSGRSISHQKDSARYTGARAKNVPQASETHFPRSQTNFQGRAMRSEGRSAQPRRSGPGRPRAARGSRNSEPQWRKRDAEQRFDLNNLNDVNNLKYRKETDWTAEEQQYLEQKKERESDSKARVYEPEKLSQEIFAGTAPATASNELGLSEMLGERLLLAKKYLDREFIQWESREQKADVMAVVEKLKAVRGGRKPNGHMKKTESASPNPADGDEQSQSLMQRLIAGQYAEFRKLGENDILGHVERHVHRNDSFYPEDEKSLLEKVRSIMPAGRAPKVGRRARNEVKA